MYEYSENAKKIYEKLYLQEGETIDDCHHRVANFLATDNLEYNRFKYILDDQIFRINTPCMTNAGVKENPNLCACYILDLEDSMSSIIDMWGTCARIYEGGGGAGIPITNLREEYAPISSGGEASGPLSYMKVIQSISDQVKSGGRNRRAANLISYKYDHPDAFKITNCKKDKKSFQAINLSMLVDDAFMQRADNKNQYMMQISPKGGSTGHKFSTSELWDQVLQSAWETGDPGLLFSDRINQDNPLPILGDIVCSNPCGEIVGMPWTSCVLGHWNLNRFLMYINNKPVIGWETFNDCIYWGVLMLNRIIEKTAHPNKQFEEMMLKTRPIGLGFMGLADILYEMHIPYDSEEAQELVEEIQKFITQKAFRWSKILAKNGVCPKVDIPSEDATTFAEFLKKFNVYSTSSICNTQITCIAPTGSTAISADCSYGFEPHMALVWTKQLADSDQVMHFFNNQFKEECDQQGIKLTDELIDKIKRNKGSIQGITEFPKHTQKIFVTAHDIDWRSRIDMQAAAQKWITMSISSTVNLPNSATKEDVAEVYKYAWQQGLKGITIFRDGCLDSQPVDFGGKDEEVKEQKIGQRPQVRSGKTVEVKTPDGKLYVTGNYWNEQLKEVFISMSNQDSRTNHLLNSVGRILSRSLQYDVPLDALLDTMRGGGGELFFLKLNDDPSIQVSGVIDAIAHIVDKEYKYSDEPSDDEELKKWIERCPSCGSYAWRRNGSCRGGFCESCGFSNCQ